MSECPDCGMRDDDWFLCRREPCVAINRAVTVAAEASADEIARLQEQLEAVTRERDRYRAYPLGEHAKVLLDALDRAEAAEARAARLEAALRRISDMCPATQEMTVAHMMADEAEAALDVKEAG